MASHFRPGFLFEEITAAFAIPLAALVLAYVLIARPRWFREWVEQVYREAPP